MARRSNWKGLVASYRRSEHSEMGASESASSLRTGTVCVARSNAGSGVGAGVVDSASSTPSFFSWVSSPPVVGEAGLSSMVSNFFIFCMIRSSSFASSSSSLCISAEDSPPSTGHNDWDLKLRRTRLVHRHWDGWILERRSRIKLRNKPSSSEVLGASSWIRWKVDSPTSLTGNAGTGGTIVGNRTVILPVGRMAMNAGVEAMDGCGGVAVAAAADPDASLDVGLLTDVLGPLIGCCKITCTKSRIPSRTLRSFPRVPTLERSDSKRIPSRGPHTFRCSNLLCCPAGMKTMLPLSTPHASSKSFKACPPHTKNPRPLPGRDQRMRWMGARSEDGTLLKKNCACGACAYLRLHTTINPFPCPTTKCSLNLVTSSRSQQQLVTPPHPERLYVRWSRRLEMCQVNTMSHWKPINN